MDYWIDQGVGRIILSVGYKSHAIQDHYGDCYRHAELEYSIEEQPLGTGGGNQTRQPYLKDIVTDGHHREFPETEHVHFYGFYIGNFPDLRDEEVDALCEILNSA